MVSTLEQMKVPNGPLLASRTRCNVLWKPPEIWYIKFKIGNKVQFGVRFKNSKIGVMFDQLRVSLQITMSQNVM